MAAQLLICGVVVAVRDRHALSVVGSLPREGPVLEQEHRREAAVDGPRRLQGSEG